MALTGGAIKKAPAKSAIFNDGGHKLIIDLVPLLMMPGLSLKAVEATLRMKSLSRHQEGRQSIAELCRSPSRVWFLKAPDRAVSFCGPRLDIAPKPRTICQ